MEGVRRDNAVQEAHSKDAAEKKFHNGREMQEMLPLWKGTGETMLSRKPIARMRRKRSSTTAENRGKCCRCGRRTEGLREGEENSAETLDHCPLGAKRLSLPIGEGLEGGKKKADFAGHPPLLGDLLPSVAHPRPPAAGFAEDEEKKLFEQTRALKKSS